MCVGYGRIQCLNVKLGVCVVSEFCVAVVWEREIMTSLSQTTTQELNGIDDFYSSD